MGSRRFAWTLNNWTEKDEAFLKALNEESGVKYIIFGYEVGEEGTPHFQGYVETMGRIRFQGVQKMLLGGEKDNWKRVHVELSFGDAKTNENYCTGNCAKKNFVINERVYSYGTPMGGHIAGGLATKEAYAEFILMCEERRYEEAKLAHPSMYAKHLPNLDSFRKRKYQDMFETEFRSAELKPIVLYQYQGEMIDLCMQPPDERYIHVFCDLNGKQGKSGFIRYLKRFVPYVFCVAPGPERDVACAMEHCKVLIVDCTALTKDTDIPWSWLEHLKSENANAYKFGSRMIEMLSPHVFVFCNSEVWRNEHGKLYGMRDRLHIIHIALDYSTTHEYPQI